jgi:crotonobetainyl-CoA:carnitine CoA-transferase CaiB-like acyl-CoA transferase
MKLPLEGIKVLDLSRIIAGPTCAMHLADLGAEVIKVEPPGGDHYRFHWPVSKQFRESSIFLTCNHNKKSLTLDFRSPEGKQLFLQLAEKSDVLVQNFRPGVEKEMGLDYESLGEKNPRLVYCSISGYGTTGPLQNRAGLDFAIQAESGLMSQNGEPDGDPMKISIAVIDFQTALYATQGILAALWARGKTGRGREVRVSLYAVAVSLLAEKATEYLLTGRIPPRMGNRGLVRSIVSDLFATADGYVVFTISNPNMFVKVSQIPEFRHLKEDPRFATMEKAGENIEAFLEALRKIFLKKDTGEWIRQLVEDNGLVCSPVRDLDQVFADPLTRDLHMVQQVIHPHYGAMNLLGIPLDFPESPTRIYSAPPAAGQHTEEVLKEFLGLPGDEIKRLKEKRII